MGHFTGVLPARDFELAINSIHLCFDGIDRDDEFLRDFWPGTSGGEQAQNTQFLRTQQSITLSGLNQLDMLFGKGKQEAAHIGKEGAGTQFGRGDAQQFVHLLSFVQKETLVVFGLCHFKPFSE